jgi:DNA-binding NtrC family response regulator
MDTDVQAPDERGLRILLVEDDPNDLFLARDMLNEAKVGGKAGHEVVHADTLAKALELLGASSEPVDLIVSDLTLPDSEGLGTCAALRKAAPDLPIVILSGRQDEALALEAVRNGAQDYLIKGEVESKTLGKAVQYGVERYRYTDASRKSHDRFRVMLDEDTAAQLVLDREGLVLHANPTATALLGVDLPKVVGLRLTVTRPGPVRLNVAIDGGPRGVIAGRLVETVWEGHLGYLFAVESFEPEGEPVRAAVEPTEAGFDTLRTASPAMRRLFATCERVAPTPASVLLLGETGTGKELLARAIHRRSGRRGRFVAVNCATIPETLFESELFGHEKGAFTGANQSKPGLFRQAEGGTLVLDEIGSLSMGSQLSLLRTLQERTVRPVGGTSEVRIDVRVIAATSVPLFQAVERGEFREDLLYRLDVIRIEVPPLRDRPEDILHLFRHFCEELGRRYELTPPEVGQGFLEAMLAYPWPGNVRQLENFTERLLLTGTSDHITGRHFHELTRPYQPGGGGTIPAAPSPHGAEGGPGGGVAGVMIPAVDEPIDLTLTLDQYLDHKERSYVRALLESTRGRMQEAAERAGIDRRTMLRKLRKHGLDKGDFR